MENGYNTGDKHHEMTLEKQPNQTKPIQKKQPKNTSESIILQQQRARFAPTKIFIIYSTRWRLLAHFVLLWMWEREGPITAFPSCLRRSSL